MLNYQENKKAFPRRKPNEPQEQVLIVDTGGGTQPTITKRAWKVMFRHNTMISMQGYQSKASPQICAVVNATTKVTIPGREDPVIFEVNYATLIEDDNELESLVVPFTMMRHGIQLDMIP